MNTAFDTGATVVASLAGRCTSGEERGQGSRLHIVVGAHPNSSMAGKGLCGAKPGRRSVGWSLRQGEAATCPRCVKKVYAK